MFWEKVHLILFYFKKTYFTYNQHHYFKNILSLNEAAINDG